MSKHRIAYIDAMRGFTMFLVVYYHVLGKFQRDPYTWGVNDIFVTFRMPLFFFLSGFLMYKANQFKDKVALGRFLKKKGMAQLFPTLFFSLLFSLIVTVPYNTILLDRFKGGYWFTYTLFCYFAIYSVGDYFIGRWISGRHKILIGFVFAILIYAISKYSAIQTCPWHDSKLANIIGVTNFQFFIFFYIGAYTRAYFGTFDRLLHQERFVTVVIAGFVLLQFVLQLPLSRAWFQMNNLHSLYSLLQSLAGFWGIALVFIFFRSIENRIVNGHIGHFLQYSGTRTLDIYLMHFILIQSDMSYIGTFLAKYPSFLLELIFGGIVSFMIICLCLLVSRIIRCSDTLANLLFGKVIKE